MEGVFPEQIFETQTMNYRDRVFSPQGTLMTMVLTATQENKSLKNSVSLYYGIHQKLRDKLEEEALFEKGKDDQRRKEHPVRGRPRKKPRQIPKSKEKDI